MKLYDEKGNLVDANGKIIETKESLDKKKKPAVKEPVIVVKDTDDVVGAVKQMAEILQKTAKDSGERLEKQKKMEGDLEAHIKNFDEFQTMTESTLGELNAEAEEAQKSIFDVVMKAPVFEQWGYGTNGSTAPIERALYQTHTTHIPGKGWVHDGKAYDLDSIVYQLNDMLYLTGMHKAIVANQANPGSGVTYSSAVKELESYKLFNFELGRRPELRKALNTDDASDWVPTGMSATLIDDLRLDLKVAALFGTITLPAKGGSFDNPLRGGRKLAYLQGESTSDSATKYPAETVDTSKVTFTAVKHALRMLFSDEMDEDSAIAIMPLIRAELIQALSDAQENAVINGDTASTHMDSDVTSALDVRKSFDGVRKHGNNGSGNAAVDISSISTSLLRSIRKGMGKYGVNPKKNAWVTGISGFIQMLSLTEVLTMDKFGSKATIVNGQLAAFDGSPIVVSEFMRQDLNTSGVFDATTETDTEILSVYTPAFRNAEKPSGVKVETARDIETGQNIAVAHRRLDFKQVNAPVGTAEETVGVGYSLTS